MRLYARSETTSSQAITHRRDYQQPKDDYPMRRALLPCRPDKRPTTGTPHYTDTAALLPFPDPPSLSSAPSSPPLLSSSPPLLLSSLPIQKPKVHLIICGSSTCVNFFQAQFYISAHGSSPWLIVFLYDIGNDNNARNKSMFRDPHMGDLRERVFEVLLCPTHVRHVA